MHSRIHARLNKTALEADLLKHPGISVLDRGKLKVERGERNHQAENESVINERKEFPISFLITYFFRTSLVILHGVVYLSISRLNDVSGWVQM